MRSFLRVSIGGLMTAIALGAVVFTAIRTDSEFWTSCVVFATGASLAFATLSSCVRTGSLRTSWLGFVIFGGAYALAALGPWADEYEHPRLPTTALLARIHDRLPLNPPRSDPRANRATNRVWNLALAKIIKRDQLRSNPPVVIAANRRTESILDETFVPPIKGRYTLEDVLKIAKARSSIGNLSIYVDPEALDLAHATMSTEVDIDTSNAPFRRAFDKTLRSLQLGYEIDSGLLSITTRVFIAQRVDYELFLKLGHSLFALLAGMIGGGIGRKVWTREMKRNDATLRLAALENRPK